MKQLFLLSVLLTMYFSNSAQITGIKISGDTCSQFTLDLQAEGTSSSPYFFWHFDDPASGTNDSITITGLSPSPFPTHTFTTAGVFNVCVSFQEPGQPVATICRTISIGLCCNGLIQTTDSCLQNNIPFSLLTGATINTITWNFGDIASGANNTSNAQNPTHQFTTVGTYTVTASVNATCGTFADTNLVKIVNCNATPCEANISYTDTCLDIPTSFQINSPYPILSVNWLFNDPNSGVFNTSNIQNPSHKFSSSANYNVRAIVNLSCGIDTVFTNIVINDCDTLSTIPCKVWLPNAFSPNNDDVNDKVVPFTNCTFESFEWLIYNRWGQLIFESKNPNTPWKGEYKGVKCPVGVYVYLLKYKFANKPETILKGDITLLH